MSTPISRRLYVAFSATDAPFVARLVADIQHAAPDLIISCDPAGDQGEASAFATRKQRIAVVDYFLAVLSPSAAASTWVNGEIDTAWELERTTGKPLIVPVIYRATPVREDLAMIQMLSFAAPNQYDTTLRDLMNTLTQPERNSEHMAPTVVTPVAPKRALTPVPLAPVEMTETTRRRSSQIIVLSSLFLIFLIIASTLLIAQKQQSDANHALIQQTQTSVSQDKTSYAVATGVANSQSTKTTK